MAIAKELLLTERTGTTGNIERHHYMISAFEILNTGSYFFYYAGELMSKGHPYTCIRNKSMIQVKIRTTDTRTRYSHNSIVWMQNFRIWSVTICANPEWTA